MIKKTKLSPQEATTFKKICSLKRDNISTDDFWLSIDQGTVTIAGQRNGQPMQRCIIIPRKDFNKLIKFYTTKQTING